MNYVPHENTARHYHHRPYKRYTMLEMTTYRVTLRPPLVPGIRWLIVNGCPEAGTERERAVRPEGPPTTIL